MSAWLSANLVLFAVHCTFSSALTAFDQFKIDLALPAVGSDTAHLHRIAHPIDVRCMLTDQTQRLFMVLVAVILQGGDVNQSLDRIFQFDEQSEAGDAGDPSS